MFRPTAAGSPALLDAYLRYHASISAARPAQMCSVRVLPAG